ncbi:hypothetical protein BDF19DRAFT_431882 [Syncephalis fuscata]|nr:hypothetical protein BDF19DRAFT_431882 [Syncephalis fuscata]
MTASYAVEDRLRKLENDLCLLRYPYTLDTHGVRESNIQAYLPVLSYLLTEFSHPITTYLENLPEKSKIEPWTIVIDRINHRRGGAAYIVDAIYRLLREELDEPHPRLSEAQLFDNATSAELKLDWITYIMRLFRHWHNDLLLEKKSKSVKPHQIDDYQHNILSHPISVANLEMNNHPTGRLDHAHTNTRLSTDQRRHEDFTDFDYLLDGPSELSTDREKKYYGVNGIVREGARMKGLSKAPADIHFKNEPALNDDDFDQLVQTQQEIQTEIRVLISKLYKLETQLTTVTSHLSRYQLSKQETANYKEATTTTATTTDRIRSTTPQLTNYPLENYRNNPKNNLMNSENHASSRYRSNSLNQPNLQEQASKQKHVTSRFYHIQEKKTNQFALPPVEDSIHPIDAVKTWRHDTFSRNHWAIPDDETIHSDNQHHRRRRLPDAYEVAAHRTQNDPITSSPITNRVVYHPPMNATRVESKRERTGHSSKKERFESDDSIDAMLHNMSARFHRPVTKHKE